MTGYTAVAIGRLAKGDLHPDTPPQYIEDVMQDTWGHLAPKVRKVYTGHILFTRGAHAGDYCVIEWTFRLPDGTELDNSPWLFTDMHDKVLDWIRAKDDRSGGIWRFDGTFERLKNGRSRWVGKVSPMRVTYRFPAKAGSRRTARAA